ncbi:hypothetical protein E2C01_096814 [Portunus trituberculatus]|uniref:Uncharacterized protein n=1 Tax=Portunus trituberculatus TaxID=210409 RepID=A0A5B7K9G9_PORTR|nr:hypothetical protein [Portunus trituberculatus]
MLRTAPLVVVLVLVGLPYPHCRHAIQPGHASVVADGVPCKEHFTLSGDGVCYKTRVVNLSVYFTKIGTTDGEPGFSVITDTIVESHAPLHVPSLTRTHAPRDITHTRTPRNVIAGAHPVTRIHSAGEMFTRLP